MADIRNWRVKEGECRAVYERDERWQVRVLETDNNGERQWSVQLLFDDDLRHTIATDITDRDEAWDTLLSWIRYHHAIIT